MRQPNNPPQPEHVGQVVASIGTNTISFNHRWLIHIGLEIDPPRLVAYPILNTPLAYRPYGQIGRITIPLKDIPGLAKWRPRHCDAVASKPAIHAAHAAAAADLYRQALAAIPLWRKREALNKHMQRRRHDIGNLTPDQIERMKATGRPATYNEMSMEDVDFWFAYMRDPSNFTRETI